MTIAPADVSRLFARCRACDAEMDDGSRWALLCQRCADEATLSRLPVARTKLDSLTPERYRWATPEAPELVKRVSPPGAIGRAFAAKGALSLVLMGPAGSGKTCLARAVWLERALARIDRVRRDEHLDQVSDFNVGALFTTSFDVAKARREYRLGYGEAPVIADAKRTSLLLLDELGAEAARGDDAVGEVIHERHAKERPSIFTTPFGMNDLADRYGDGIARRVFEGATVIALGSVKR